MKQNIQELPEGWTEDKLKMLLSLYPTLSNLDKSLDAIGISRSMRNRNFARETLKEQGLWEQGEKPNVLRRQVFTFHATAFWPEKDQNEAEKCIRGSHEEGNRIINHLVNQFGITLYNVSYAYAPIEERHIIIAITVVYKGTQDADLLKKTAQNLHDTATLAGEE